MSNESQGRFQPQLTDFGSGEVSGTIWNHDNGYQVESATQTANTSWIDNILDPTGLVKGFYNDLTGVTSQSREFSQQEYLQDKQNEYNKPINEMKRMIEAGINPNVAAAGIAGNGSPSASPVQVSSNTGGTAAAMQSAASGLSSLSQMGVNESVISENKALTDKYNEETRLLDQRFNIDKAAAIGELAAKLVGIGIPELEAAITAFDIGNGGYDSALNYLKGFQGIRQYTEKLSILVDEKELKCKELEYYDDLIDSTIDENRKKSYRDEKEGKLLEINAWFENAKKEIVKEIPALMFEGNSQLLYLAETLGTDSDTWKNFQKAIYDTNFTKMSAEYAAKIENAYDIAFDEWKAKNDVDASFARYYQRVNAIGQIMIDCYRSMFENPRNLRAGIAKYLDQIYEQLRDLDPDVPNRRGFPFVNNAQLPDRGHPRRNPHHPWE